MGKEPPMRVADRLTRIRGPPTEGLTHMVMAKLHGLTFVVPPRCQGQIVEYSYAADHENGRILLRVRDRSMPISRQEKILARPMFEDEEFEPWNREPRDGAWSIVS